MDAIASPLERETASSIDPVEAARAWLGSFDRVALATVIATWGSSPVPVGGQLAVAPDGRFQGSVSGGCVEAEVLFAAEEVIKSGTPRVLEFGVSNETAWRSGLPCGGRIEILVEAIDKESGAAYLDALLEARPKRKALVVRTALSNGERTIYDEAPGLPGDIAAVFRSGQSQVVEGPQGRAFLHVRAPAVHLIIVGATHIAQILIDLARRVGWSVALADPRSAFATDDRFGCEIPRSTDWPEASLAAMTLDSRTAVITLTHVGNIDDEALISAIRSPCFYIGALGSRRTHAARVGRLQVAGLTEAEIGRIHAPIGLNIGAVGPAEIAVSILSEIVKELRGA
jgi:xanthine dehydrogenase accessory factor